MMQTQVKKWGNGSGVRFTKEFLREAGITMDETLNAEIINGQIVLTPVFRHRSLRERAAEFNGALNLSDEIEWDEPVGNEVW
jgi:antitoxin MazE